MTILLSTPILFLLSMISSPAFGRMWKRTTNWCPNGVIYVGDFNGDNRQDLLCHNTNYESIDFADHYGKFSYPSWWRSYFWCSIPGDQIHIGDFNGDGRSDILCHNSMNGYKKIRYANYQKDFSSYVWQSDMRWCRSGQLLIGDFNGDGRDDMMCHTKMMKQISYADQYGRFTGTSWYKSMGWCTHTGSELHLGDFNGNGRADMLCHDTRGNQWVAFATCAGTFTGGTDWHKSLGCSEARSSIHIADFNGDGRDDILCHYNYGNIKINFADFEGNFKPYSWWTAQYNFCYRDDEFFFVGDFDGDNHSDMFCHKFLDHQKIAYATSTGVFNYKFY